MDRIEAQPGATRGRIPLKHVLGVFVGNGLEFYDFLTFSYFAVYIARTFYPGGSASAGLLKTLAVFGAGFLTRPIGAVVIGRMGDRRGRKPAMLLSFALMGVGIVGMACTPSYAAIGPLAPALVLLFRLVQGFALGGEVGPSTAYMAEAAPLERRGLYLSMQSVTQDCAVLAAGLVGTGLAANLTAQQLQDWGWRAALLVGASIVPFGLVLRRTLPETLGPRRAPAQAAASGGSEVPPRRPPLLQRIRPYRAIVILGLLMLTSGTIGSYTMNYMTTYALDTLHLSATISFSLIVLNGGVSIVFEALSGWLSDRFGRKPVMVVPGALLVLAILPCFQVITRIHSPWALYGASAVMTMLAALTAVPVIVTITETLPPHVRSGAVATIYAVAISLFGGSTQFVLKLLLDRTGDALAPAYYWTAAAVLGLVAKLLVTESAPLKQRALPGEAVSGPVVESI